MARLFTRLELYDLVWSRPTRTVAASLGVSDVGLAKTCRKAEVPIPPRGYWARKPDEQRLLRPALPPRFPGGADRFEIGGDGKHYRGTYSDQDILDMPVPPEPVFEEPLEAVAARIDKMVGKVPAVRNFDKAFGDVARLLSQDEERKIHQRPYDKPLYESGVERRRLLLLNSLFLGFYAAGCKASMSTSKWQQHDEHSRTVSVTVGAQHISFTLDPPLRERRRNHPVPDDEGKLRLALGHRRAEQPSQFWEDGADAKLETRLREIVTFIMLEAEKAHRERAVSHRTWVIGRKADIEKQIAEQRAEQEREALRAKERQHKAAVDILLKQAADLQKAQSIRVYVSEICRRAGELSLPKVALDRWSDWALTQADRIDPTKSLQFLQMAPSDAENI